MITSLSTPALLFAFAVASLVIVGCGTRMTGLADRIADRSGLGEALVGGVLLGAATSISGLAVTLTAAIEGRPSLAFSNGVGGIAAQTVFLALADLVYRKANLEHAAADLANLFQAGLLILLLTIPVLAYFGPEMSWLGLHPASLVLLVVYGAGVFASNRIHKAPPWDPIETADTDLDKPDEPQTAIESYRGMVALFVALVAIMGATGWTIALMAGELADRFDISATLIGALMTSVITSLPELVTTLAAVRRGALQLAVGGIIGGNMFDTLFLTVGDLGYRKGSIYHALDAGDLFWLATGLTMTTILLLGLMYRQRGGPAGIGFESAGLILVYAAAVAAQALVF